LIALATASLLDAGVKDPSKNMVVIAVGTVATSIISKTPFSEADLAAMNAHAQRMQFVWLLGPGHKSPVPLLDRIASARSIPELHAIVAPEPFDYMPPTDERPYFFNMVKPSSPFGAGDLMAQGGILAGNLTATVSLGALFFVVLFLVALVIIGPLVRSGFPRMPRSSFALSVGYFAAIGGGFMLIQIGFMQRFSVYLGHPTYAVAIILFSMILATGIGSLISDRIPLEQKRGAVIAIPLITAALVGVVALILQQVIVGTIEQSLGARAAITIAVVAPVSIMLGMFFPMGMRLVGRLSQDAMPWMWGINGACGVLSSVIAVAISMWSGIHTNFYLALLTYALIAIPAVALWKAGKGAGE
jgi:hypothetical protein